jgi:hypothetical protein
MGIFLKKGSRYIVITEFARTFATLQAARPSKRREQENNKKKQKNNKKVLISQRGLKQ